MKAAEFGAAGERAKQDAVRFILMEIARVRQRRNDQIDFVAGSDETGKTEIELLQRAADDRAHDSRNCIFHRGRNGVQAREKISFADFDDDAFATFALKGRTETCGVA